MNFNGCLTRIFVFTVTVGLLIRQLTKRSDSEPTSRTDYVSGEENEEVIGQLTKRSDSEPTSRTDDVSGEENEEVIGQIMKRSDSEPTLRTDDMYGEENEEFDPQGIDYKDAETTGQMTRKRSTYAIWSMETESPYQYDVPSMETEPAYRYDVFLSFCGVDTRKTFTDHLYHKLKDCGIRVFLDSEELNYGKKIEKLLEAIDESQIYIPIFSQKFASRVWCLREVGRMLKRHSESDGKREIFPIFYDVDADDVKLRTNLYKNDILKHKGYCKPEELEQWRRALKEVGRIYGPELKGKRQGEQINLIVEEVLGKLPFKHVDMPEYLVQDHGQIKAIIEKLDVNSGGVRFVKIHGTGGIGKTTLAKTVFKELFSYFERVSFLRDIRERSEPVLHGLVTLQKELIRDVDGVKLADQVKNVEDGKDQIKIACQTKKILLVLDDVNGEEQLKALAGKSNWFGLGSRIIITTRDNSIRNTQGQSSGEEVLNQTKEFDYEVQSMEPDLALELFSKHAFESVPPTKDYDAYAEAIVSKVGRLPLAVQVMGSYVCRLGFASEPHDVKIELLKETLQKLDKGPDEGVRNALMISYQVLTKSEKKIYLDIACFFTNEDKTYPIIMWKDRKYQPESAIRILWLRSLIKIRDNKFWMHDQVKDLGRYIVREEYPCKEHPCKYSRVWTHKDAVKLLAREEDGRLYRRNPDVKALSLTSYGCSHNFAADELAALPNLKFLQVKKSDFCGNFENRLLKLRWLSWQIWQTTFHANNFHFSNLIVLDLSGSHIDDGWDGWSHMKMNKLKVLDLTNCLRLKTTPDLSNFTSLEKFILAQCVELITIHNSIGRLNLLKMLNIKGCSSLSELPAEIGSLQALEEIIMPQNSHPFKLPETFGDLQSLSSLILDEHPGISQLPNSLAGLVKVTRLSLRRCVGIKVLPCSIGEMKILKELDLSRSGIVEIPDSIGGLKELKVIRVSHTAIRKFPCTIGQVEMLEELHAKKCWHLTDENLEEIRKLSHLTILDLSYTEVSEFPLVQGCLSRLQTLETSSSHLPEVQHLPPSLRRLHLQARHFPSTLRFTGLVSLDYLELHRLTPSTEEHGPAGMSDSPEEQLILPLSPALTTLIFKGISILPPLCNLKSLSVLCIIEYPMSSFSVSEDLKHLKELKLSKCKSIKKIPGLSLLKYLERLDLNRMESLVEIDGLSELESLLYFRISHCGRIERSPNLSKLHKLGQIVLEACPSIKAIEGIEGFQSLVLDPCDCTVLKKLTGVSRSTWLSHKVPKNKVFLSFTGPETCYSIVDSLSENLIHHQVLIFRNDAEPSSGDGTGEELLLDDFDIYIPILSKNYASSGWHLRELAHMVECTSKSHGPKKIVPIFHDVEVYDVKLESELYKSALVKHRRKFGNEVEVWEKALKEVGRMRGFDQNNERHRELIDWVVEEVLCKLNAKSVDVPEFLIGCEDHAVALMNMLDRCSDDVKCIVIHGMNGIGKTTCAKVLFNKLFSQFDGVCFLNDVGESSRHGFINLQKRLLSSFVGVVIADHIEDNRLGDRIKRVCETRKILIVLDDLDRKEQFKRLVGKFDWFGYGSTIIITTRDENLMWRASTDDRVMMYELQPVNDNEALVLFCNYAFKRDSPIKGYEYLARGILDRLHGHHLLCEVIGSYLYCHGCELEPHDDKRRLWEDTLRRIKNGPFLDGLAMMRISYQSLDSKQKEIFLDIACFFINEDQTYPVIMWDDCNYDPQGAIPILLRRSLIKIRENKFWMHDLLRLMGRCIIHEEYPCKFSRVWCQEDAVRLLGREERNEHLKALSLTSSDWSCDLAPEQLAALPNLRFLRVEGIEIFSYIDNHLSELRWLSCQVRQTTLLARNFHFSKLVVLNLSDSNIEDGWGGWKQIKVDRLKVLDLTGCKQITTTPDFSDFSTLEMLVLARCVKLATIHVSLGKLKLLKTLNLEGCSSFGELPEGVRSRLPSLTQIIMPAPKQG